MLIAIMSNIFKELDYFVGMMVYGDCDDFVVAVSCWSDKMWQHWDVFIILALVKHYEDFTVDLLLVDMLMIFNNTKLCWLQDSGCSSQHQYYHTSQFDDLQFKTLSNQFTLECWIIIFFCKKYYFISDSCHNQSAFKLSCHMLMCNLFAVVSSQSQSQSQIKLNNAPYVVKKLFVGAVVTVVTV